MQQSVGFNGVGIPVCLLDLKNTLKIRVFEKEEPKEIAVKTFEEYLSSMKVTRSNTESIINAKKALDNVISESFIEWRKRLEEMLK
ncbi:hypothetical protein M0R19_08510 [Candidatus Pacearchaeota archaeon]|jgi:hypothetical protein|nr:hypothetical protein [bacterium]MCK9597199.1 hypothetical protein [Candidatus Pacearchaeota archaeon]